MVKITNECCDCAAPGYPCLGDTCPNRHVKHYICDHCKEEFERLYIVNSEELCQDCLEDMFEVIGA